MKQTGPGVGVSFRRQDSDSGPKPGLRVTLTTTPHPWNWYRASPSWLGYELAKMAHEVWLQTLVFCTITCWRAMAV